MISVLSSLFSAFVSQSSLYIALLKLLHDNFCVKLVVFSIR